MKKLFKKLTKRTIIAILALLIIGVPLLYLTVLNQKEAKASWYDDNWAYRQTVTVTVTSSTSDITNLETLITVNTSALISSKLQSSCQDLRFTNAGGKLLPYYIDSGCNTTATKIWVLADLVPKNTTTYTLFMYYGNPTAVAGTDANTFWRVKNLVGYWTLNESSWNGTSGEVKDSSVNGNNGTGNGNATTTSSGKFANGGTFDGSGDFVDVGDPASGSLDLAAPGATVAYWIKFNALAGGALYDPLAKADWNGSAWVGLFTEISGSTGILNMSVSDGSGSTGVATGALTTGTWYHITFVWESNGTSTMYVNGASVSTGAAFTGSAATAFSLRFGRNSQYVSPRELNGLMDDIRMYSRVLSASEISQLYTNPGTIATTAVGTSGPSTSFATEEKAPGPIAYWKFDEGTGTTAQDTTSTNADGAISGATWQTEDQCIAGKCLRFDGTDDYVNSTTGSQSLHGDITLSAWFRPNSVSQIKMILCIGDEATGKRRCILQRNNVIEFNGYNADKTGTKTFNANEWHHAVITRVGSTVTIYIDGVLDVSGSPNATLNDFSSTTVNIGSSNANGENYGGTIDEVKVYGYARSAAQVLTDYNSRGSVKGSSTNLSASTQNQPAALSNGLVGYWKMDESSGNLTDSSGNANTGTVDGTTATTGKFGNGRDFNGSTNYADAGSASTLDNTILSVATWVKADTISGQAVNYIASKFTDDNGIDDQGWALGFLGTVGTCGEVDGTPLVYETTNNTLLCATTVISTGSWYHLVFTYDGTTGRIYVNGVLENSAAMTFTEAAGTSLNIGRRSDEVFYLDGKMDETRIYNRALSPAEVSSLYNFAPGPRVYLKMDEGSGTSANDSSGNTRTGTINGNPIWSTGKYGKGIKMDGTGDDIQISDF